MVELTKKKEMRIALCKECNFDCFFCHSEGLDRKGRDSRQPVEKIVSLIERSMELGFSDITFTGGEPLLRHRDIARILNQLGARQGKIPDITIVSNASILPRTMLDAAQNYPGNIKFNVSVHSIIPERFREIVRVETDIETVLDNIRALVAAGLKVKLNSVVLNGMNAGKGHFESFLNQATDLGAAGVKFLELLVTPSNHNHYKHFYSDEAICRDLAELSFTVQHSTLRTRLLSSPLYPGLPVEITRCTCKLGCANCSEHRDRQFDSLLRVHPCFVLSDQSFDPGDDTGALIDALKQVNANIDRYAALYGNDSPILVPYEVYVESKQEVYFSSKISPEECQDVMRRHGYEARKKRSFHIAFCLPESADREWLECKKVLKYGFDIHTPNKFEIISSKEEYFTYGNFLVSKSIFMTNKPVEIPAHDIGNAKDYIQSFGYKTWFERSFHINDYMKNESMGAISIDHSTTPINMKINKDALDSEDSLLLLRELEAEPIMIPFPLWLKNHSK